MEIPLGYLSMEYLLKEKCIICNDHLTSDCARYKTGVCSKCTAAIHESYEIRHSGASKVNYKRTKISINLRSYILKRDGECLKCKSKDDLTIDHIISVANGGDNHHSNLQTLCRKCNSIKSKYPEDYREVIE